jgi:hypothetical protein
VKIPLTMRKPCRPPPGRFRHSDCPGQHLHPHARHVCLCVCGSWLVWRASDVTNSVVLALDAYKQAAGFEVRFNRSCAWLTCVPCVQCFPMSQMHICIQGAAHAAGLCSSSNTLWIYPYMTRWYTRVINAAHLDRLCNHVRSVRTCKRAYCFIFELEDMKYRPAMCRSMHLLAACLTLSIASTVSVSARKRIHPSHTSPSCVRSHFTPTRKRFKSVPVCLEQELARAQR